MEVESRFRCRRCWWWPNWVKRLLQKPQELQANAAYGEMLVAEHVFVRSSRGVRVLCKGCAAWLGHADKLGVRKEQWRVEERKVL